MSPKPEEKKDSVSIFCDLIHVAKHGNHIEMRQALEMLHDQSLSEASVDSMIMNLQDITDSPEWPLYEDMNVPWEIITHDFSALSETAKERVKTLLSKIFTNLAKVLREKEFGEWKAQIKERGVLEELKRNQEITTIPTWSLFITEMEKN